MKNSKISKKLKESWCDPNSQQRNDNVKKQRVKKLKEKWEDSNSKYNSLEYREKLSECGKILHVNKIKTEELCGYGCGRISKYIFGNGKLCCEKNWQSCPKKKDESRELILIELGKPNNWFRSKECSNMRKERMLNGGAIHALSYRNNISKPQLELFEVISNICPYVILEYSCLNYSIDIAVPSLNLAIEYDGSYYHQDIEYDKKRQKELEGEGWLFLRYRDYVPDKKEVFNDMRKLLNGTN